MSIIDISESDKTKFKCYKFDDGSLYYGETEYVDENKNHSIVLDINEYNDEMIKKLKVVRHGCGVQIFGVNDTNYLYKYEGEWVKDKKQGKGIFYFSDKSIYEGNFLNDTYHGYGKFTFPSNDVFIGEWKEGKMDGEGEFKHHDGHVLKGLFKNNYYLDKDKCVNPFLSSEDLSTFKVRNREFVSKFKFESEKFSKNDIFITKSVDELNSSIETCIMKNKTPIIIRSRKNIKQRQEILKYLKNQNIKEIDFRNHYLRMREKPNNYQLAEEIQKIITESFSKGSTLLINFDDCSVKYEELFDPDLKEFYSPNMMSPMMFTPRDFANPKVWSEHFKGKTLTYDKNFMMLLYSKFVIDITLPDESLIAELEKRFNKALPMRKLCFIIVSF